MKIVLHIGTDKTGSTAIQEHLILNRTWLQQRSVYTPEIGLRGHTGHSALLSNPGGESLELLAGEVEIASSGGYDTMLLSWEGMNFYSPAQIKALYRVVSGHQLIVLAYLREQADLVQTGFLQRLKSNTNRFSIRLFESPSPGAETFASRKLCRPPNRNYYKLLRRWQQGLGGAKCLVRIFDRDQFVAGDLIVDFLEQLGVRADGDLERSGTMANASLDVPSGMLVDRWQRQGLGEDRIFQLIDLTNSYIARNGATEKYFLAEKTVLGIRKHYRKSNKKVAKEFLGTDAPLFAKPKECWYLGSVMELEKSVDAMAERIHELDKTPTLVRPPVPGLKGIELASGWNDRNNWGAWSCGDSSMLRFRILRRPIFFTCAGIGFILKGRYTRRNNLTRVTINGISFGDVCLSKAGVRLDIPLDRLRPYEGVEIVLHHQAPLSSAGEGDSANRLHAAFGLERVAYRYLEDLSCDRES